MIEFLMDFSAFVAVVAYLGGCAANYIENIEREDDADY